MTQVKKIVTFLLSHYMMLCVSFPLQICPQTIRNTWIRLVSYNAKIQWSVHEYKNKDCLLQCQYLFQSKSFYFTEQVSFSNSYCLTVAYGTSKHVAEYKLTKTAQQSSDWQCFNFPNNMLTCEINLAHFITFKGL